MLVMDIDRQEEKGGAARRETAESKSRVMGSWTPLAGDALLDRLRVTGRPRPLADPDRAVLLRETIERGLAQGTVANQGGRRDQSPSPTPLVITKDRLTRALSPGVHHDAIGFGVQPPTTPMACGALIDVLFRQLVTIGSIGDPMSDGLAALALDDRQAHLIAWIDSLSRTERERWPPRSIASPLPWSTGGQGSIRRGSPAPNSRSGPMSPQGRSSYQGEWTSPSDGPG